MKRKKLHVDVSDVILIAFFLILMLGLALTTPKFLTFSNLMRVLQQMAELGIASLGILLVICFHWSFVPLRTKYLGCSGAESNSGNGCGHDKWIPRGCIGYSPNVGYIRYYDLI